MSVLQLFYGIAILSRDQLMPTLCIFFLIPWSWSYAKNVFFFLALTCYSHYINGSCMDLRKRTYFKGLLILIVNRFIAPVNDEEVLESAVLLYVVFWLGVIHLFS